MAPRPGKVGQVVWDPVNKQLAIVPPKPPKRGKENYYLKFLRHQLSKCDAFATCPETFQKVYGLTPAKANQEFRKGRKQYYKSMMTEKQRQALRENQKTAEEMAEMRALRGQEKQKKKSKSKKSKMQQ